MRIGIVGGTGKEGRGLGARWAKAGHDVRIGSRDDEWGRAVAAEIGVAGGGNAWAASESEIIVVTVPYAAHRTTLESIVDAARGRVIVDITVPLAPPKVRIVHLPPGRAAALEAREILGADASVAAALHHVSSVHLADPAHAIDCDVLVCATDDRAREAAIALVQDLGLRAFDAGPLENAVALEALTPVLLHMNKRYGSAGTGIRITGIE